MKDKKLTNALNYLDDEFVSEAIEYKRQKPRIWLKWGAMAACFAVIFAASFFLLPYLNQPDVNLPDDPDESSGILDNTPDMPVVYVDMNNIKLNEISEISSVSATVYNPAVYEITEWSDEEIIAYFGKDMTSSYAPSGMTVTVGGSLVSSGDNHVVHDDFKLTISDDPNGVNGAKISISTSKLGNSGSCKYILPEKELEKTEIGGVEVTFGYLPVSAESSDADTEIYDMYAAEFTHEDIEYLVTTEDMEFEEIVRIVSSIIYGNGIKVSVVAGNGK